MDSVLSGYVPAAATAGYAYKLTLSVTAAMTQSGQRSSQAEIIISIVPSDAPTVSMQYVSPKKINPSDKLRLLGTVENVRAVGANCSWSVNDASIHLPTLATTPTSFLAAGSSKKSAKYVVNFALVPNALSERAGFTFTFSCSSSLSSSSSSSLEVSTNGPPLPGQFVVIPKQGVALQTSFMFLSSKWFDEDLPLSYSYGFIEISGTTMTLQSRSEISYSNASLPAGAASAGFALNVVAQVFDVLNGVSTAYNSVTVNKTDLSSSALKSLVSSQLSVGSASVDSTKKIIATASSILNDVDCSKSPNCTQLNR